MNVMAGLVPAISRRPGEMPGTRPGMTSSFGKKSYSPSAVLGAATGFHWPRRMRVTV